MLFTHDVVLYLRLELSGVATVKVHEVRLMLVDTVTILVNDALLTKQVPLIAESISSCCTKGLFTPDIVELLLRPWLGCGIMITVTRFLCASELPNLLGQTVDAIEEVVNCDRLSRQLRLLLLILLLKLICKQHEFVLLCTRLLEELLN